MGQYNENNSLRGDYVTDDICNAMALRSDVHKAFDDRKFVCVPKESHWVVHFFNLTNNLGRIYHNTIHELDPGISPNLLFVRFAWTVFPLIQQFLSGGTSKELRLRVTEEREHKVITKLCTAEEIAAIEPMRGRNPSPKEREVATEIVPVAESRTIKRQRLVPAPNRNLESRDVSPATSPSSDLPSPRAHALQSPDLTATSRDTATAQWIRSRRPCNPDLYCCNYNDVEAAMKAGLPGKEEFGGAHLCLECLGVEYRDEIENDH